MSFTDEERSKIKQYLGVTDLNAYNYYDLDSKIDSVGALTAASAIVRTILSDLDAIESAIRSSVGIAGIKSADNGSVEFFELGKLNELRRRGRGLCNALALKFGTKKFADYFGEGGSAFEMPTCW